jgi:ABC-2 type transport system permease protein
MNKRKLKFYIKIWSIMARNSFLSWLNKRSTLLIFITGKLIRYAFSFGFLYFLVKNTNGFGVFNANQALFFAITFLFIDTLGQLFFRNVYTFRQLVVSGDLDMVLVKPVNPLFRVLLGGPDVMDLITLPPILFVVIYIGSLLEPSILHTIFYILLVLNSLIISASIHIFVLAIGIITLEIDHTIMIFRDISSMGRIPIDLYKEPLKSLLIFGIPVGVMMTIPAKAMMGIISFWGVFFSIVFGISLFYLSLQFWNFALKKYTSASS